MGLLFRQSDGWGLLSTSVLRLPLDLQLIISN